MGWIGDDESSVPVFFVRCIPQNHPDGPEKLVHAIAFLNPLHILETRSLISFSRGGDFDALMVTTPVGELMGTCYLWLINSPLKGKGEGTEHGLMYVELLWHEVIELALWGRKINLPLQADSRGSRRPHSSCQWGFLAYSGKVYRRLKWRKK